jgi:hypothetical protein
MEKVSSSSLKFHVAGEINDETAFKEAQSLTRPEDSIPDLPENQAVREFLKTAPTKGLYMPLGKEVKVMQCWRCKAYGHRTGDRSVSTSLYIKVSSFPFCTVLCFLL